MPGEIARAPQDQAPKVEGKWQKRQTPSTADSGSVEGEWQKRQTPSTDGSEFIEGEWQKRQTPSTADSGSVEGKWQKRQTPSTVRFDCQSPHKAKREARRANGERSAFGILPPQ